MRLELSGINIGVEALTEDKIMNQLSKLAENQVMKRIVLIIAIALSVSVLFPLFLYSNYNFISLDDYSIGAQTHLAWVNRTSLFSGVRDVLISVVDRVSDIYMTWGGNYSSMIFTSLQPGIFNEKLAFINTYILLGSFTFSVVYFFLKLFHNRFGFSKTSTTIMISGVLILSTQWLPSALEAFYWFNGSFYNIVGYAIGLVFIANMYEIAYGKQTKIWGYILTALIGIFVAGTNYTIMLFLMLLGALFGVYMIYDKCALKNITYYVCIYVIFVIFCFINICAPGNSVRQGTFVPLSVTSTIYNGLVIGREMFLEGINPRIFILFIILLPFLLSDLCKNKFEFRYPLLFTAIVYALFSSLFAPTLYATHSLGPVRTQNVYYWTLILLHVCNYVYWVGWIQKKIGAAKPLVALIENKRILFNHFCVCLALCFVLFEQIDISAMTSFTAVKSIISGEAQVWKNEMNARQELLNSPEIENVLLEPLSVQPELVATGELEADAEKWPNTYIAEWYQKESVALNVGEGTIE